MAKFFTLPRRAGDLPPDEIVLAGSAPVDRDKISKLPRRRGQTETIDPRSRKHERWFRGLVGVVADGIDRSPGYLYSYLKAECGYIDRVYDSPKGIRYELTSATRMSEAEYKRFTDRAIEVIFRDFLVGVPRAGLFSEVEKRVGPRPK